ncbi:MAG: ATP synthase F1 subunit epsilon [bacterium]|jgi:F-type H+-transporting ATPase subunit epsilon
MIHLKLVTLTGVKFDDDVHEVLLPTLDGRIGVLTNHMPLVSAAATGIISIRRNAKDTDAVMEHFATNGGVIEVANNTIRVIVDEADNSNEINEAEVKSALDRAMKMKTEAKDQVSLEHAQTLIDRNSVRLRVAQLRRRTHR